MKTHNRSTNEDEEECFYDAIDNDLFFNDMKSISNQCESTSSSGDESENYEPFYDTSTCGNFTVTKNEMIDSENVNQVDTPENNCNNNNNDEEEECEDFELETAWSFWLDKLIDFFFI